MTCSRDYRRRTVVTFLGAFMLMVPGSAASQSVEPRVWVASAIHAEVAVIDVASGEVIETLSQVNGGLCAAGSAGFTDLAGGAGAVWAVDADGRLCRIDPSTLQSTGEFLPADVVRNGYNLAADDVGLWVVGDPFFWHVDGETMQLTDAVAVEHQEDTALDVVVSHGTVWGLRRVWPWSLYRVPSAGGATVPDSVEVSGTYPETLGAGFGSVWAYGSADPSGMEVLRIEGAVGRIVARISVPNGVDWHEEPTLAVGEGHVWLGMGELGKVGRVDPQTQAVTGIVDVGGYVWSLAAGAGGVWVGVESDDGAHQVVRVDPVTLEIVDRITIDGVPPRAIVVF